MGDFSFYLKEGINHITDPNGIDHMLFVITLCAFYKSTEWKNVLILITAFTLGHSLTLALSALNIISINQDLVELLIPITILLTSIYNVSKDSTNPKGLSLNYLMALGFGLIHGMGFSNYFKAMMMGISDNIILPLLAFNVGVELGQLLIVIGSLIMLMLFIYIVNGKHRDWKLYVSGAGGGLSLVMIIEKIT